MKEVKQDDMMENNSFVTFYGQGKLLYDDTCVGNHNDRDPAIGRANKECSE